MERTTGCLGWIGAITLGLILGGFITGIAGPIVGVIATVGIIWGFARLFATPVRQQPVPEPRSIVLESGPVPSLRGTLAQQGSAADVAPAGDSMIALPLIVHPGNFDTLGDALGLAEHPGTMLYRDAVTQPGPDGVQVAALARLLAHAGKRDHLSAAPIGAVPETDLDAWPQLRSQPFEVQVAMQRTPEGVPQAWLLFRRGALFRVLG
jgi:hypothetical protein